MPAVPGSLPLSFCLQSRWYAEDASTILWLHDNTKKNILPQRRAHHQEDKISRTVTASCRHLPVQTSHLQAACSVCKNKLFCFLSHVAKSISNWHVNLASTLEEMDEKALACFHVPNSYCMLHSSSLTISSLITKETKLTVSTS